MWWLLAFTRRWLQWGSKGIFNINKIQSPNPERWKANNFMDPILGNLVYQLLKGITLACDICLGHNIDRWKYIIEEIHFGAQSNPFSIIEVLDPKKTSFKRSKWPQKFKNRKYAKNCKLLEECFVLVGKGGWTLIST